MNQCFLKINDMQVSVLIMGQNGCASVSEKDAQI